MALFAPVQRNQQSSNLVEFRAGKMSLNASTSMVHPDKRKGLVYIYQSNDALMHFCWKDRSSGVTEEDLIIFPEDAEFKRVKECTTGRVFLLKMKGTGRKLFFWMQEPKTEKDAEILKKVSSVLNHGPSAAGEGSARPGRTGGLSSDDLAMMLAGSGLPISQNEEFSQEQMDELSNSLAQMGQSDYLQMLSGLMGGSSGIPGQLFGQSLSQQQPSAITHTPTLPSAVDTALRSDSAQAGSGAAAGESTSGGGGAEARSQAAAGEASQKVALADLQSILSDMKLPTSRDAAALEELAFEEVLNPSTVLECVSQRDVEALEKHLPSDAAIVKDRAEIDKSIRSPQFAQAVRGFGYGLQSGQLTYLLKEFGLPAAATAAAAQGDMKGFAEALQKEEKPDGQPEKKSDQPEDQMELD